MRNVWIVIAVGCLGLVWAPACKKRGQRADSGGNRTSKRSSGNEFGGQAESDAGDDERSSKGEEKRRLTGRAKVMWTDRPLMGALEERGLGFEQRVGASRFGDVASVVQSDLEEFQREDPKLGVGVAEHPHRMFDPRWLGSSATFFELAGVVSRMDRRPFVQGACGEVRLVYRMVYEADHEGRPLRSRLPMTVAVDWLEEAPGDAGCRTVAGQWHFDENLEGKKLADAMTADGGPLEPSRLGGEQIHRLRLNFQSVRWPSTVHPSLGGHAEYVLRSFVPDGDGGLEVQPLENTPDVNALRHNAELKEELLDWIRDPDHLDQIDAGTAKLPEKYLADRAISVAPHGLSRRQNRPFFRLFERADFEEVDFEGFERVRSEAGLIRRLDDHSCMGCHQSRAVAGFHLLGEDDSETVYANALAVPVSAHATDEQRRRRELVEDLARGRDGDYARPFAQRPGVGGNTKYGTPCGLTDEATFRGWECADGLECRPYNRTEETSQIGICLPKEPQVGDPCQIGDMRSREDPVDDRIVSADGGECPSRAVCNKSGVGFPGGMCTTDCEAPGENGRCGAIAVLKTFNRCLAKDRRFDACLTEFVRPAGLRACDRNHPCRHDYLCAKNNEGKGVCIPPYFLFQMRVDGHPEVPDGE